MSGFLTFLGILVLVFGIFGFFTGLFISLPAAILISLVLFSQASIISRLRNIDANLAKMAERQEH